MRFKMDECIPEESVQTFTARGYEVETVRGQGYTVAPDADIVALRLNERYTLVTVDRGLGNIAEHPPRETSGIIVIRPRPHNFTSVRHLIETLLNYIDTEEAGIGLHGRLIVINRDRTIRRY